MTRKKLAILGATGSIGLQALEVIENFPEEVEITLLTGYSRGDLLLEKCQVISSKYASLANSEAFHKYRNDFQEAGIQPIDWKEVEGLISSEEVDVILNALVGAAGLAATVKAVKHRKKLLLANKESLVIGGEYLCRNFENWRENVIPVDSEHSALFQCLEGENEAFVRRLIITGSGGPFRNFSMEKLRKVTPDDALKHPTWKMGKKITIDSATLMNKGLEVIEAHYLFKIPFDSINVIIHPQSIIHGMVIFTDDTIKAVLSNPDMKLPIEYALFYPERKTSVIKPLIFEGLTLDFEDGDIEKFKCLKLALNAGRKGGIFPAVMNAANEVAVNAFLSHEIGFLDIPETIEQVIQSFSWSPVESLQEIFEFDKEARSKAREYISKISK